MVTIQNLMDTTPGGGVITLTSDYTEAATAPAGKELTIDLGGHTWTAAAGKTPLTVHDAKITLRNGSMVSSGNPCVRVGIKDATKQSYVTLEDTLTLTNTNHSCVFLGKYGHLDTSADMTSNGPAYCIAGNGSEGFFDNTCIIRGGTLQTVDDRLLATAIYWPQRGDLSITGGSITGYTAVEIRAGNISVSGGSLKALGAFTTEPGSSGTSVVGAALAVSQHSTKLPMSCVITGGIFTGEKAFVQVNANNNPETATSEIDITIIGGNFNGAVEAENCKQFIEGGTFSNPPGSDLLVPGIKYVYAEDGSITVYMPVTSQTPSVLSDTIVDGTVSSTKQGILMGAVDSLPKDGKVGAVVYDRSTKRFYRWVSTEWKEEAMDIADDVLSEDSTKPIQTKVVEAMREDLQNKIDDRYTRSETNILLGEKQNTITGAAKSITAKKLSKGYILQSNEEGDVAASNVAISVLETLAGIDSEDIQKRSLTFKDMTITSWSPVEDTSGEGYTYMGHIPLEGVGENDYANVVMNRHDAMSGKYAPDCDTVAGGVRIYSRVNAPLSIPVIYVEKGDDAADTL